METTQTSEDTAGYVRPRPEISEPLLREALSSDGG
jgi:hypothetical protein